MSKVAAAKPSAHASKPGSAHAATAHTASAHASAAQPHPANHGAKAHAAHHVPGGKRNVALEAANHHPLKQAGKPADANRLGTIAKTNKATAVYDDHGKALGSVKAGLPIRQNAGQICRLKLADGQTVTCVLAFSAPTSDGPHTAWIPLADLGDKAQRTKIGEQQKHLKAHIDQEQQGQHAEYAHPRPVQATVAPAELATKYVYPRQTGVENSCRFYFCRGGVVNLLFNLPKTGGQRFGVASDVVQPGSAFHMAHKSSVPIPVYPHGGSHAVGHLTFVFGYVVNSAGQKRYGWINEAVLGTAK